ncbi:heme peroxidase family protein [Dactylonectria estremocensis]|uniref:Heme peroxidase family protein n=1 Tax=Dactylonectria estremocensis TaxID=1079267 RepID=A0A9P9I994_9HYPO|nr:heme peroxidase family protein [Dactylonectria estremocensis]
MDSSSESKPANGGDVQSRLVELLSEARRDLLSQTGRVLPNLSLLAGVKDVISKGGQIDDRKYLVENIIQVASSLPDDSKLRGGLNARFIDTLWRNLRHPPISYLGDEFRYRTADGSNNADRTRLRNSSYLDLGPLYGNNMDEQKRVRTFKDGLLKKDTFSESRFLRQPPGVCALVVAFNRFHNYIVQELATINERGRFSLPAGMTENDPDYSKAQSKRDNDLFQTGRLITCGLYINIILGDYLRTILNLNRNPIHSDWKLDPREDFDTVFDSEGTPRGIGNQVSVEFNMIYRWHSVSPNDIPVDKFLQGVRQWTMNMPREPEKWTFGGLKRTEDGSFSDDGLVELLQAATESVAGAFGARNIPRVLKVVEIYGIQQGREWGLASLNEFREFFKLEPYYSFIEALYGHPDNIELYPGLLAEDVKKPIVPGSGLCPGFTTSFSILSDAVALVRGDRFYSVDHNPSNLTSFGFNEASSDYDVAGGGVMYKLLMRAFPGWYRANSVSALYPFTTPEGNKETFDKLGTSQDLDFNKPVFNQSQFRVPWGPHTFQLTHHDYMLSGDSPANARQRVVVQDCLYSPENGLEEVRRFYEETTTKLIRQNSRKIGDSYQVDVSNGGGSNSYTEESLADALGHLFGYVFLDLDTAKSFKNRTVAAKETKRIGEVMQQTVADIKSRHFPSLKQMFSMQSADTTLNSYGDQLVERLLDGGRGVGDTVWTIIPTAAAASATQAQGWAQMIDLYLSDKYYSHWPEIKKLALSDEPEAFEKLKKYALEGFRLSTPAFGLIRVTGADKIDVQDGADVMSVKSGDTVFTNFITAGLDPSKFPDPYEIKLDRPDNLYIHHGLGPHACLGRAIVTVAGASMLRTCARLNNFRRAPGHAGEMKSKTVNGAFKVFLSEDGSQWGPFPTNKKVIFEHTAQTV